MKGRDILKGLTESTKERRSVEAPSLGKTAGSVKALKSELDKITEEAAIARDLKQAIDRDGQIVELSPELIDGADISDRIPLLGDEQFEELKKAIKIAGQQVPILVRKHPRDASRFQAAYGHRRLQAALELDRPVKAVIRQLSDEEMILAQGQENGQRLDLSFIERALYAAKLDVQNFDRHVICSALGVDLPEVSRLMQVGKVVGDDIAKAVGPARKIGRPRWLSFAKLLKDNKFEKRINKKITSKDFLKIKDSNRKFEALMDVASNKQHAIKNGKSVFSLSNGRPVGWRQETKKGLSFYIEDKDLAIFFEKKLPALLEEFENE